MLLYSNINIAKRACKTHLQWLRYNTAPWSSVKEHWNGSREERQNFIKKHTGNVSDIFNEYPVLKQEFGYMLVHNKKFFFNFIFISFCFSWTLIIML